QGFGRHAAIAFAERLLQHRLCLSRRFAHVNVASQRYGGWPLAVNGATFTVEIGLGVRLLTGEAGAGDPAFRHPCRPVDGWGRAATHQDWRRSRRPHGGLRLGARKPPRGTYSLTR